MRSEVFFSLNINFHLLQSKRVFLLPRAYFFAMNLQFYNKGPSALLHKTAKIFLIKIVVKSVFIYKTILKKCEGCEKSCNVCGRLLHFLQFRLQWTRVLTVIFCSAMLTQLESNKSCLQRGIANKIDGSKSTVAKHPWLAIKPEKTALFIGQFSDILISTQIFTIQRLA